MAMDTVQHDESAPVIPDPPEQEGSGKEERMTLLLGGTFVVMLVMCVVTQLLVHS